MITMEATMEASVCDNGALSIQPPIPLIDTMTATRGSAGGNLSAGGKEFRNLG